MKFRRVRPDALGVWIVVVLCVLLSIPGSSAADAWGELRAHFNPQSPAPAKRLPAAPQMQNSKSAEVEIADPWSQLQAVYLSFTEEEEFRAVNDTVVRKRIAGQFHQALDPYRELIREASERFAVPSEVIAAVIMVESSGNPKAAAPTSSAKGLMQTIDATFAEAQAELLEEGIIIENDPFDPRASIMAGTWYLDKMFKQVVCDRGPVLDRSSLASWRLPTEYYYAGPGHGRKRAPVVMIYAGGKSIRVDKSGYSNKVLKWARIMGGVDFG